MILSAEELQTLLELGRETSGVEFKQGGPLTDPLMFGKVLRAVLGLANHRNGGYVIFGIRESNGVLHRDGVSSADLLTWTHDLLADKLRTYLEPHVDFDVGDVNLEAKSYLVIRIHEFRDVPVICVKLCTVNGRAEVQPGLYVRSRKKPESAPVTNFADLRDLFDLVIEKGVKAYVAQAARVGIWAARSPDQPTDAEKFDAELGDLR